MKGIDVSLNNLLAKSPAKPRDLEQADAGWASRSYPSEMGLVRLAGDEEG